MAVPILLTDASEGCSIPKKVSLRELFHDENFVTLLRAEGITDMPRQLSERLG